MTELKVLGVTVGDPAGIGPEISVATVTRPDLREQARAVVYADASVVERAIGILGLDARVNVVTDPEAAGTDPKVVDVIELGVAEADEIPFGEVQALGGKAAIASIEGAVRDALAARTAGIVTAPIHKEAIWAAGSEHLGHTEMLQALTKAKRTDTMFVLNDVCTFFATRHMSLLDAVQSIKADLVHGSISRAMTALQVFGYENPKLVVAALNPHGGENGHFGREELDEIIPAIERYNAETGLEVAGPIPADSVFHIGIVLKRFDGILSLYHDQGHIATKTLDFDRTISVTVGLPILRTSVDHGTAFDIAGTGKASAETMVSAFRAGAKFSAFADRIRSHYAVD